MMLAIFQNSRVYEGNENFLNAVYPIPSLTPVDVNRLAEPALAILGNPHRAASILFREDSFDPTTRIRRGRFYALDNPNIRHWQSTRVTHYPYAQPVAGSPQDYPMNAYRALNIQQPRRSAIVFLGGFSQSTPWYAVSAERLFNDEILFTLKAATSIGVLPDIAQELLPDEWHAQILAGAERVVDAALKYMPTPTVDVCREFTRVLLAAWLSHQGVNPDGGDLGALIKAIPKDRVGIASAANVINRLHPRGKSAEQERQARNGRDIREICDEDSELSVSLVGFLLREMGWVGLPA